MTYNELIKNYYGDLNNLANLLKNLTDSYRLLIGGAAELNNIPEARTKYVKEAVNRADKLGETIDEIIHLLHDCGESYFQYCDVLNKYILTNSNSSVILTEVDNELLFQNSTVGSKSSMPQNPSPSIRDFEDIIFKKKNDSEKNKD